jgi:DNA repair protein RadC
MPSSVLSHRSRRIHGTLDHSNPDDKSSTSSELNEIALLETTLAIVVAPEDLERVALNLLTRFHTFAGAIAAYASELRKVDGLGDAGVAALKTLHAAAIRLARARIMGKPALDNWPCISEYLTVVFAGEKVECLRVLYLNEANCIESDELHSTGSVNSAPFDARKLISQALKVDARGVILAHNHPSGDPNPSITDMELTRSIKAALTPISIRLWDHVIVGDQRHLSFRHENFL